VPKEKKVVQIADIHDNTSRLVIGALGLSLLGLLSLGVHRVVNALKGRKDLTMSRYNSHSRTLMCGPASGTSRAPVAAKPTRAKKDEAVAAANATPQNKTADSGKPKQITGTGVFKIVGRLKRPAFDDQLVYLDE
jgi:hypothetical protein